MRREMYRHDYWREEQEGRVAVPGAKCPYGICEIGRRCAWLAGYHDTKEQA